MGAKHQTPEYQRNARTIRARVQAARRRGEPVQCWRCRGLILETMKFDVGHLPGSTGSSLYELAPEHRTKTGRCAGNRNVGGKLGARITNARRHVVQPTGNAVKTWEV